MEKYKFSLFILEKPFYGSYSCTSGCFDYIETYDTLEAAQIAQKDYKQKTLILPSY